MSEPTKTARETDRAIGEARGSAESGVPADTPAPAARPPRRLVRRVLLLAGPLAVLAAGGWLYWTTGRYAETENAYVKADKVGVSARIAGEIARVDVHENERVAAGDVLFVVDDDVYRTALARADAQLRAVESMMASIKAQYRGRLEELELARTDLAYAERELEREQALAARDLGSDAEVDRARHEFDVARQRIPIIEQSLAQLRAQLGGGPDTPMERQAAYLAAKASRDAAALDLEHTIVRAPFDGIASNVPTVGRYVGPGNAAMSLVADRGVWIEANYKETDLTHVRVGQPVSIRVDTYPEREWRGEVESISPATGTEFSVIPAQNATGNWVKITQRIPVRIAVRGAADGPELRAGMSATVEIDTGYRRRPPEFLSLLQ